MRLRPLVPLLVAVFGLIVVTTTAHAAGTSQGGPSGVAPGAPGQTPHWPPADKHGFGTSTTIGRMWPIFAGERGEYELSAGQSAAPELSAVAESGNDAGLLPEQVWDQNPPSGAGAFAPGRPTFSATPLAWTHAQFIRLAWSMQTGHPVEQPSIVACRYAGRCATP